MSNWLQELNQERNRIGKSISDLEEITYALDVVGNTILANRLLHIQGSLEVAVENINKAVSSKISEDANRAQEATANMLNAALGISKIRDSKKKL